MSNLSYGDVHGFWKSNFLANNTILATSGISPAVAQKAVSTALQKLSESARTKKSDKLSPKFVGGDIRQKENGVGVYAAVGFAAAGDNKAVKVVQSIISDKLHATHPKSCSFFNGYSKDGLIGFTTEGCGGSATNFVENVAKELKSLSLDATGFERYVKHVSIK